MHRLLTSLRRMTPSGSPVTYTSPVLLGLVGLVVGGCMVGPTPDRPEVPVELDAPYTRASPLPTTQPGEAETSTTLETTQGWWQRFGDPTTHALVGIAIRHNPDLRAAAARVVEAEALLTQARGNRLPTAGLGASRDRRKQSLTLPAGIGGNGPPGGDTGGGSIRTSFLTTTYDVGLDVSWQIDLWGRLRRAQQAADFEFLATAAEQQALVHTIIAETIRGRVAVATLEQRLELARQNLESLQETLKVSETRYESGVGDPVSVRLARENVASAEAQIPPLEAELAVLEHALAVLLGGRPGVINDLPDTLPPVPTLPPPPTTLPAALLDQRPDLLASELRSKAAQARIGVAVADLLPNVTLGAGYGFTSSEVNDLLDNEVYNLLVSVAQPIFEGGRRRAAVTAARARAEAAAAEYTGSILVAIREVEDAMAREAAAQREVEASERALTEAQAAETLARDRYTRGLSLLLDVFEAERRRRAAEERVMLARQRVWNARIDLHLSLGGDWRVPGPVEE